MSFQPTKNNKNDVCETLSNCVIEIKNWMAANLLQLNTGKTELNIFGTCQMLLHLRKTNCNIGGDIIDVTSCAKNLGVFFDNSLSMNDHINLICKKSFNDKKYIYHMRFFNNQCSKSNCPSTCMLKNRF